MANDDFRNKGEDLVKDCRCYACRDINERFRTMMYLCVKCGNKRCPHATNHLLACTGSNEPGQSGSIYE